MQNTITIDGKNFPMGRISLQVDHFPDDENPYTEINLVSASDDGSFGGVALNCLAVPLVAGLQFPYASSFQFDTGDDESGTELGESVFWQPGDETLEIRSLSLAFGPQTASGEVQISIMAECFDDAVENIEVSVNAVFQTNQSIT